MHTVIEGFARIYDVGCAHLGFAPYSVAHIRQNRLFYCAQSFPKGPLRTFVADMNPMHIILHPWTAPQLCKRCSCGSG